MLIGLESMKYSLKNLLARKSRSLLTILSIFVGIATIFIFISFGYGLYGYITELSEGSSVNKIIIQARGTGAPGLDDTFKLLDDDLEAVESTKGVMDATGVKWKPAEVWQGKKRVFTFLAAYDPKNLMIFELNGIGVEKGRFLRKGDKAKVMLGYNYQIPDRIFPKPFKIGDKIEVQGIKMDIIGFVEEIGSPPDDAQIYITNDYIDELYEEEVSYAMILGEVDTKKIDAIVERVEKNLRKERDLEEGKEDFFVQSFQELIDSYAGALNIVIGFIVLIALISVLVSAVNTANTMVTSVLERVKEIGVIKSIGARNSEIFKIFLFESAFLGFVSGALGVLVGWGISASGGALLNNMGWGFLQPKFTITLFVGAILFATITGAVSGFFPAYQASKLKPVDALRYE